MEIKIYNNHNRTKGSMGNVSSAPQDEVLTRSIADDGARLYWPSPPSAGPLPLASRCSSCGGEAVVLHPFPDRWAELLDLRGHCYACMMAVRISVEFREASRAAQAVSAPPLWTFDGRSPAALTEHLRRFLRWTPPSAEHEIGRA